MRLTTLKTINSINSSPTKNTRHLESSISFNFSSDIKQMPKRNIENKKNTSSLNISSLEQNIKFNQNLNPSKILRLNMPSLFKKSFDCPLNLIKGNNIEDSQEFQHYEKKHYNQAQTNMVHNLSSKKILCRLPQKHSKPDMSNFLKKSSTNKKQIPKIKKNTSKVNFIRTLFLF